jgi:hypothetical protein
MEIVLQRWATSTSSVVLVFLLSSVWVQNLKQSQGIHSIVAIPRSQGRLVEASPNHLRERPDEGTDPTAKDPLSGFARLKF